MANPMRTVSFKIPEGLDDALSDLSRKRKSTRSALVRQALEALTTDNRLSVTAAVGQLVGSLNGPTDLSTHRKHMAGYGK